MRQPLVAGNWKMFKTVHETSAHIAALAALVSHVRTVDIVVAPPFTAIHAAAQAVAGSAIAVAAQDMHWERDGAFTGAISGIMLREAGATSVLIGHSERRTLFGETNLTANRKVRAALTAGLRPVLCVGESLDQRERNETLAVLDEQLKQGLDGVTGAELGAMVLAYEPVWAIGSGRTATPQQAGEAHAHVRTRLRQWFGVEPAMQCRILYGGSVKPDNIAKLMGQPDIDGALVGGASLDPKGFADIVAGAAAARA